MSQQVSLTVPLWHKPTWHKVLVACLSLVLTVACADRSQQAMQYAAEANQHLQAGELWLARQRIAAAIAERDDLPELHLLRGRIEVASESFGSAFAAYSNALSLDNTNMEALQAVSQLGLSTGNLRESLEATERILVLQPNQESALLVRGIHAFARRRYDQAIQNANRILDLRPASEEATILKSRALFMNGDPEGALQVIDTIQDSSGDSEGVARTKLELYREAQNPAGMQAQFNRLRQLRPDDADLRIDEANLRFKLGDVQAGQELLHKILMEEGLSQEAANQAIGLLKDYSIQMDESEMQEVSAKANETTLVELARYFLETGRRESTETILRELPVDDAQPLYARLALLNNQPLEALELAGQVLKEDETQCDALVAFARASLVRSDVPGAIRSAQRAAAECPNRNEGWLATAAAYSARGEPIGVKRVYRDAVKANPQDLLIAQSYADWLADGGRHREALAVARSFVRKSPALVKGWEYYRSLCLRLKAACVNEAQRGLIESRARYGSDMKMGNLSSNALSGRLVRR